MEPNGFWANNFWSNEFWLEDFWPDVTSDIVLEQYYDGFWLKDFWISQYWPKDFWQDFYVPAIYEQVLSPAELLKQYLNEGYVNNLPDVKEDAITIFDTTPLDDGRISKTGERVLHYGIQIAIRYKDYEEGYQKLQNVSNILSILHNEKLNQYTICNAMKISTGFVGVDDKRRNNFVSNFILTIIKEN